MSEKATITKREQRAAPLPPGARGWSPAGRTRASEGYVPAPLRGMAPTALQAAMRGIEAAEAAGLELQLPDLGGVRTPEQQQRLYEHRAENENPVAPPGASTHQYGMGMDLTAGDGTIEEQQALAKILEPHGWRWAGQADPVHFTYVGGTEAGVGDPVAFDPNAPATPAMLQALRGRRPAPFNPNAPATPAMLQALRGAPAPRPVPAAGQPRVNLGGLGYQQAGVVHPGGWDRARAWVGKAWDTAGAALHAGQRGLAEVSNPLAVALQRGTEAGYAQDVKDRPRWQRSAAGFVEQVPRDVAAFGRGVFNRETLRRAAHSLVSGEIERWEPFPAGAGMPGLKKGSTPDQITRGAANFLANVAMDNAAMPLQGKGVSSLARLGTKGMEKAGLFDVKLPKYGKSIRDLSEEHSMLRRMEEHRGAAAGAVAPIARRAQQAVAAAEKAARALARQGINLRGKGLAGHAVNLWDETVTHLTEAGGGDRAKFSSVGAVRDWIRQQWKDPKQAEAVFRAAVKQARLYRGLWKQMGTRLEEVGYLEPGTVKKAGGRYVIGIYHSASENSQDIEIWRDMMRQLAADGKLTDSGLAAWKSAEARLGSRVGRGTAVASAKGRTLTTFAQREAHGAEFQSTPLFARSMRRHGQQAEIHGAIKAVAEDPTLARPGFTQVPVKRYSADEIRALEEDVARKRATLEQAYGVPGVSRRTPKGQPVNPHIAAMRNDLAKAQNALRRARGAQEATPELAAAARQTLAEREQALKAAQIQTPAARAAARRWAQQEMQRLTQEIARKRAAAGGSRRGLQDLYRQRREARAFYQRLKEPGDAAARELAGFRANAAVERAGQRFAATSNRTSRIEHELAEGVPLGKPEPLPKPPGTERLGEEYGKLTGHDVHPAVKARVDRWLEPPSEESPHIKLWTTAGRIFKAQHVIFNLPVVGHKLRYDGFFADARLAEAGLHNPQIGPVNLSDLDALGAARKIVRWRRAGSGEKAATEAIRAVDRNTRVFHPGYGSFEQTAGGSLREAPLLPGARGVRGAAHAVIRGGQKARAMDPVAATIGLVEQSYKVALTERLAPVMGYDKAAQEANRIIGDWHATHPAIQGIERYAIPFSAVRLRGLGQIARAAAFHPEVVARRSMMRLPGAMTAAAGPEGQARAKMGPPGSFPAPGMRDWQGRQSLMTRNPFAISPGQDLLALGGMLLGPAAGLYGAASNVDVGRSWRQGGTPITKGKAPGEAARDRLAYLLDQLSPSALKAVARVTAAGLGRSKGPGRFTGPDPLAQAIITALTGAQFATPLTLRERGEQAQQLAARQRGYLNWLAIRGGEIMSMSEEQLGRDAEMEAGVQSSAAAVAGMRQAGQTLKEIEQRQDLDPAEKRRQTEAQFFYMARLRFWLPTLIERERAVDAARAKR